MEKQGQFHGEDASALKAWVAEAEKDTAYTRLAVQALRGDEEAQAELRFRFPWPDGPAQRWQDIPSASVRALVQCALEAPPQGSHIAALRHTAEVRGCVNAAYRWAAEQSHILQELVEA